MNYTIEDWKEKRRNENEAVEKAFWEANRRMLQMQLRFETIATGRIMTPCPHGFSPRVGSIACRYRCKYGLRFFNRVEGVAFCRKNSGESA